MIPVYLTLAGGTFTWIWCLCLFSDDVEFNTYYLKTVRPHNWTQWIMLLYAVAFISSMQTQASHELIHRRENYNKALGMFGLMNIHYIHFKDEHVMGHHKHLATIEDSSTSRLNESIYWYMIREVYSTNKNMWQREFARIRKQHGSDCPTIAYILFNKMTWYYLIYICTWVSIYLLLGWNSLKFHFVYSLYGLWYQCFANYMTHYGLLRNKDKNGIYESINKYHSWNFVSSPIYYRLPRHSDHHTSSFRPYQILRRFDDAPWNPYQFVMCLYLCQCPPLWFWAMNPRVQAVRDFCNGKVNTEASFNNIQKQTEKDKKTDIVVSIYFALCTSVFGYVALFGDLAFK